MKLLEELTAKVNLIVESNKKLKSENEDLRIKLKDLSVSNSKLENSLLKENGNVDSLNKEKDEIKVAIESLLDNISKFEESKS